jgi:Di-haem oxidoreductase, putative peroxidase
MHKFSSLPGGHPLYFPPRKFALPFALFLFVSGSTLFARLDTQVEQSTFRVSVPRVWDDQAIATVEVPLANPVGSPKHISSDYYYKIPVRPIYKSYPVYAPGHEPAGYMERLKAEEPEVVWDDAGHKPPLKTEADWMRAGEMVFDTPIYYTTHRVVGLDDVRNPSWYEKTGAPIAKDGTLPYVRYVIRKKGEVDLANFACGFCHTRVMPDGNVLKGGQGNFPFEKSKAWGFQKTSATPDRLVRQEAALRRLDRSLFAAPWVIPDPLEPMDALTFDELVSAHEAMPAGVLGRHRANLFYPIQVPDLIGVKDRHYLDHTGLQKQRSIGDLMRYAAFNQGADDLASFDGFIPADMLYSTKRPDPTDPTAVGGRYSDEQLYALASYLYSLQAPANPNKFDSLAARGQKIFTDQGCVMCHTPPLYTSNKLTPAEGFNVTADARANFDILPLSVGTDPNLTMKTRRGTGYYKVPSLKGAWYRGMFGHSGWCAKLEDWFDPNRVQDDYVPTGFKPYGAKTFAVKGHRFGLDLSVEDRTALVAFLKTL